MRWILPVLVTLTLTATAVRAAPESPPTPGDIAEWIRSGTEANLERAAQASEGLDATALRAVIAEVRDQSRVHAALERRMIKDLSWNGVSMQQAIGYLRTISGVSFFVSPGAREHLEQKASITMEFSSVNVKTVMDAVTTSMGLAWRVRQGVVMLGTRAEIR